MGGGHSKKWLEQVMDLKGIAELVGNFGVPTILLFWVVFRLDRFLNQLVEKLEKYNKELGEVGYALRDIVQLMKGK